jgi:hypothetical protein
MSDDVAAAGPMLQIDGPDAAEAPYLSYNVPDPTSYAGRTYTELAFPPERAPFGTQQALVLHKPPNHMLAGLQQPGAEVESQALPEPGEPTGGGTGDEPRPSAVVTILTPAAGSTISAPESGTSISVVVSVRYVLVDTVPGELALRAGNAAATATIESSEGDTSFYTGTITVRPGSQKLRATVQVGGAATSRDERLLQVDAVAGTTTTTTAPPQLTVQSPPAGRVLSLPQGEQSVAVEFSGGLVDGTAPFEATYAVDGRSPTTLEVGSDGRWIASVALGTGTHALTVALTDGAGRTASATRSIVVLAGAYPLRRLFLVDVLRLSNFLGRYGAGRVVQTMSLLPGEKTTIAVRTFRSTKVEESRTESILESASDKSTASFEDSVAAENSTASKEQAAFSAKVSGTATGNWGVTSASVTAEAAYNTASAREDAAKRVSNATRRHAGEKSSERTVAVEGKTSTTSSQEDEQTITRELVNTNLSRTLNFVFRQMTQEFVSILHLVDIRVGMFTEWFSDPALTTPVQTGTGYDYEEVTLPRLRGWLRRILGPGGIGDPEANVANVYRTVLAQLDGIFDYTGEQVPVIEDVRRAFPVRDDDGELQYVDNPLPGERTLVTRYERWQRFDPGLTQTWDPTQTRHTAGDPSGITLSFTVPGVILSANVVTLRTDGVVCDAFLGGGPALDVYSTNLQRTSIAGREAETAQATALAARDQLGIEIVRDGETAKADLYAKVFPPPPVPEPTNGVHA